jgi:predicted kinase
MEIDSLKKELIIMIGMSFSGKTYYVDMNLLPHYQLVSKIHVLKHLKTNKEDPMPDLLEAMQLMVKSHMSKGLPIVIDQNNLSIRSIFLWSCIAGEFRYEIRGILIDTPFNICMNRLDYACGHKVSQSLIDRMIIEKEKLEELKIILNMKHQSIIKNIEYIPLYTEEEIEKSPSIAIVTDLNNSQNKAS